MNKDGQNIESLFNKAFDGSEVKPPENVWSNLEKQLDEASIDGLFKTNFENAEIEPPIGMWAKIQQGLWMKDFMRFTPNKINVYYTSLVAIMAGLGLFMSNDKQEINAKQTIISKTSEQYSPKTNKKTIVSVQNIKKDITDDKQKITVITTNTIQPKHIINNIEHQSNTPIQKIPSNTTILPSGLVISGDTVICVGTERRYEIIGDISNVDIKWTVNPKNATIEKLANNKIAVTCNKAGLFLLEVEISNNGNKKTLIYQVRAVDASVPTITGNATACEGTQTQFKISNAKYISKMYSWDVAINKYNNLSSSVIIVDCKTPGYDTIKIRDINTKTGCNNTALFPIIINSKPEADFKIIDNGSGVIDLQNTSKCGQKSINCRQTVKWLVNDQSYTKNNITVEFTNDGVYTAILEVQNEFNCKETIKKDITINLQNLFVPNAFISGNENDLFIPKGENLATYEIEIFDASNRKLWESNQITDGRPSEGWDGKVNGQSMPIGTYYWKISASFKDGTIWKGVNQKGKYQTFGTFFILRK